MEVKKNCSSKKINNQMLFKNLSWQEKVGFLNKDIRMSILLPMEITVMVKVKQNMKQIKIQNYKTLLAR